MNLLGSLERKLNNSIIPGDPMKKRDGKDVRESRVGARPPWNIALGGRRGKNGEIGS